MDEASKPEQREPEARSHGMLRWIVGFAIALVLYPLSTGPIIKLTETGFISDSILTIYGPLDLLAKHSKPIDRFFEWYVTDIWNVK